MKRLAVVDIRRAFSLMGAYLRERKTVGEVAVFGGSAIMLQFDWRHSTRDVDAMVVSAGNHGLVREAADFAARELGLERSWLSEAVAQYTSRAGSASGLAFSGIYPENGTPGLRVVVAKPDYLLAMKLAALAREAADDRDFDDARKLASGIGATSVDQLEKAFLAYFPGEELPERARLRLPALAEAIRKEASP